MPQRTLEILVGLFVVAGIGALVALALQVSGLTFKSAGETYRVYAYFNDAGGLSARGRVSMAGVTVGRIAGVDLDPDTYQARVAIDMNKTMSRIPADSMAVIRTAGILGEQYIDISIGGDFDYLQDGDEFYETQSALNLEQLISNFAAGGGPG